MADGFDFGPAKTQIPTATTSEDGLMSAADKTLLNTLNTQLNDQIKIKKYTVPLNTSTPNSITVSGIGIFWIYGGTNGTTAYITTETAQGNKTDSYPVAGSANLMIPVKDGQKMNYTGGVWSAATLYALEFPVVTV